MTRHAHAEAFNLMIYRCDRGHEERIWNSRDGVTPFIIDCRYCENAEAVHHDWNRDQYLPTYHLTAGDRFFRDGTIEEARSILRNRFARHREQLVDIFGMGITSTALRGRTVEEVIDDILAEHPSEFRAGWPMIDTAK